MAKPDTLHLQSYDLATQDIATADLDGLNALSISVGWPHRQKDWQFLRSVGRGLVALDEIGRVFSSGMWFGYGEDCATIGMMITSPRVQTYGGGRFMMDRMLDECGDRRLILNSTRAGYALYISLGFEFQAVVQQMQGTVRAAAALAALGAEGVEEITPAELPALLALDRAAFGADRSNLVSRLAPLSRIVGLRRDGVLEGYAMRRAFGRGQVVGPIVAQSEEDAIALAAPLLADLEGRFARVDTRQPEGRFRSFLLASGLPVFDTVKTLTRGAPLPKVVPGRLGIYGLAAQPLS